MIKEKLFLRESQLEEFEKVVKEALDMRIRIVQDFLPVVESSHRNKRLSSDCLKGTVCTIIMFGVGVLIYWTNNRLEVKD